MPSALSHPAVPLALALALGSHTVPTRLLLAGVVAAVVPDLDAVAFKLEIPYGHALGHRGASHSLVAAAVLGLVAAGFADHLRVRRTVAFAFVAAAAASHGLLDMLTNGGHGVALAWPASAERLWWPARPIEASPLSFRRFFTNAGVAVVASELRWIWAPCLAVGLTGLALRWSIGARRWRRTTR